MFSVQISEIGDYKSKYLKTINRDAHTTCLKASKQEYSGIGAKKKVFSLLAVSFFDFFFPGSSMLETIF